MQEWEGYADAEAKVQPAYSVSLSVVPISCAVEQIHCNSEQVCLYTIVTALSSQQLRATLLAEPAVTCFALVLPTEHDTQM